MSYYLPSAGKAPVELTHFPTKHQAFIFRAYEYVPKEKIAAILKTTAGNVEKAAHDMGLCDTNPGTLWLEKGYITIIRRMWHILPYSQLLELLEMDKDTLAATLREEDFLDIKLGNKPVCDEVCWRELTDKEKEQTALIKKIVEKLDVKGRTPFDFEYDTPKVEKNGKELFKTRMIYAFSGLYQNAFDVDSEVYLPDVQLEAYRDLGINGIWTQGVLSRLTEFVFDKSVSEGYKERIKRMRTLTERLDKYGIKLYLYINEPRSMPLSFFENHADIKGHVRGEDACLCISTEKVKKYLADAVESVCKDVPLIGGFFTITRSENMTNCYSHSGGEEGECNCERCKKRTPADVISDTLGCILDGARRVRDDIKVFAWSWRWDDFAHDIIRRLPKGVIMLSQSELDIPFTIGGVEGSVLDYSMSIPGPGERAKKEWEIARERGLETAAKVQVNTTWEASTVPELPVLPGVVNHIRKLANMGVEHLMLSWTLGGYPGRNLSEVSKCFYEKTECDCKQDEFSPAEIQFTKAFSEFPFHIRTLYLGPQNAGPSTLLFENNTGYNSTMTCFAYDDLEQWRSIYPVDVFESQFEKLCFEWEKGLELITDKDPKKMCIMANAAYCLFKSSLNQIKFVRARDDGRFEDAITAAKQEIEIAQKMLSLMNMDAAIGYEAANHYYFSKGQLVEKIVNCHHIVKVFEEKAKALQ